MEKQEFKSKWDELALELGAEVSPEAEQRVEEATAVAQNAGTAGTPQPTEPAATVRPLPKPAAGWDSLASELGLPPAPPTTAPATPPTVKEDRPPVQQREPSREAMPPRPKRERTERREPPAQRREPSGQRGEPSGQRRERSGQRREPSGQRRERSDKHREPPAAGPAVSTERERPAPAESSPPPRRREEPAKPSAAVSLWHKIFGSPAEQAAKITDIATAVSEVGAAPAADADQVEIDSTIAARSLSGEDVVAAELVEEFDRGAEPALNEEEAAAAQRKRGRPRRRRRGGRGRKSEARTRETPEEELDRDIERGDELTDIDDSELEETPLALEPFDEIDDDAEQADDSDAGAVRSTRGKSAQRAIPTWDEAIGCIVDSNLQSRTQRRATSRSDSRTSSSRGRGRGRRKS